MDVAKKLQVVDRNLPRAMRLLKACRICPRKCEVDRLGGETGFCRVAGNLIVSSIMLHHGEEPPISGFRGSGTVFLTACNLRCVFCQNFSISQGMAGREISTAELADEMLRLQKRGAHNINFVTPTHFGPLLMEGLRQAYEKGLNIPIVYNCGGYESVEMLQLWDGIVDVYMPDMKYGDSMMAKKYSVADNYVEINQAAIAEMQRQVGVLQMDENGIAEQGLLVRHLVLPNGIAGTEIVIKFLAEKISRATYVNLMSQYHPDYRAHKFPELNRRVTPDEYQEAIKIMQKYGLHNGWFQSRGIG
jgi:putative pyruvate formate lyase activating enzyme